MENLDSKGRPDIQSTKAIHYTNIDWVGMEGIELPLQVNVNSAGELMTVPALMNIKVSLDSTTSRGIHMSRLYLGGQEFSKLTLDQIFQGDLLFEKLLQTQGELSQNLLFQIQFQWPTLRNSLQSGLQAWRDYPVLFEVHVSPVGVKKFLSIEVEYSSTCPASAALSRQLIQKQFEFDFEEQKTIHKEDILKWLSAASGVVATPHSQRSTAKIKVEFSDKDFQVTDLVNLIEDSLKTPVQGAVKREDEQQFALLNGQNPLFCEDAARVVKSALMKNPSIIDFAGKFIHYESLHPHNAVSVISAGKSLRIN